MPRFVLAKKVSGSVSFNAIIYKNKHGQDGPSYVKVDGQRARALMKFLQKSSDWPLAVQRPTVVAVAGHSAISILVRPSMDRLHILPTYRNHEYCRYYQYDKLLPAGK
jgi:hypothetical protein